MILLRLTHSGGCQRSKMVSCIFLSSIGNTKVDSFFQTGSDPSGLSFLRLFSHLYCFRLVIDVFVKENLVDHVCLFSCFSYPGHSWNCMTLFWSTFFFFQPLMKSLCLLCSRFVSVVFFFVWLELRSLSCNIWHRSLDPSSLDPNNFSHHIVQANAALLVRSSVHRDTLSRAVFFSFLAFRRTCNVFRTLQLRTGYEPKDYFLMETYVESFTESLTHPQFSEQRFLEDVDYDDAALEEMLHDAHREHVCHSQREGLSVGQSSSSVSERTGRPVEERTGRPVVERGEELNVGNAQIRTLLDRQKAKSSPNVRRRFRDTNSWLIMTEEAYTN